MIYRYIRMYTTLYTAYRVYKKLGNRTHTDVVLLQLVVGQWGSNNSARWLVVLSENLLGVLMFSLVKYLLTC
jgi:hypothetical protein